MKVNGNRKAVLANAYPDLEAKGSMRTQGEPSISTQRVQMSVRMRFNPLRGLTPDRLGQYLEQFDLGFFRQAALVWDKLERRDWTIKAVAPKRKKAVARHGYDVLTLDKLEDDQKDLAEQQRAELKFFYENLTATNAIKPDEVGGLNLLARQMMDAESKYYAVHETVWQIRPGDNGEQRLTALFVFCPLWWFEGTVGKLRYLDSEFQVYGRDMLPGEWLVTCGEGLMEACSVAWMFKHLPLQDWLAACEKFGSGFIDAATSASPGTVEWDQLVEYVNNFGPDGGGVRSNNAQIQIIERKETGVALYQQMVANMDRAITILWRGGDLGTTGSKDATGASLQGDESDILEGDDSVKIEETLALKISRYVIAWRFGEDAPVLAYLKFRQEQDPEAVQFQRDTFSKFAADGTVVDVLANQTDLKKLVQDVGLPVNEKYTDPYLPVRDSSGGLVTGDTITDGEGDVIGAKTEAPAPEENPQAQTLGPKPNANPNPQVANDRRADAAPSAALEAAGKHELVVAVQSDLAPVMQRLEAIMRIEDPSVLTARLGKFLADLDALKVDLAHDPESAQAIGRMLASGLANGLSTPRRQDAKAQMGNGDVAGHEFHGNQYSEAMAASAKARADQTEESHTAASEAHRKAAAAEPRSARFHDQMAASHERQAADIKTFKTRMAGHQTKMAEYQAKLDEVAGRPDPNAGLKKEVEQIKRKLGVLNKAARLAGQGT